MENVIIELVAKLPWGAAALMILGSLVVLGQTVVAITPSQEDDKVLAKIWSIPLLGGLLKALAAFAPVQKK